jgi:hypothetical protein
MENAINDPETLEDVTRWLARIWVVLGVIALLLLVSLFV